MYIYCTVLSKVIVDDLGNGGKVPVGNGDSLSSEALLAVKVTPVNDPPMLFIPTPVFDGSPFFAEEDRLGVVGIDCCGWSMENILSATVISNSSIVLSDADVSYEMDGTSIQQPNIRWKLIGEEDSVQPNDTVAVGLKVSHGGILMSKVRAELSMEAVPAATGDVSRSFSRSLKLQGPLWAAADALKGLRYRSDLNWNSWGGSAESQLQPVISEVSIL